MTNLAQMGGEWFTVRSGRDEGRVILSGWFHTAVGSGPGASNPYYALASCPRCGALVPNDDSSANGSTRGRAIWLHEDWHAATDYPRPARRLTRVGSRP